MQIKIFIGKAVMQPPQKIRLKKDLKLSTLQLPKCKIILLKGSCKLQKSYIYD